MCCSACRRRYRRFMTSFEAKSDQCHVTSVQGSVTWVHVAFSGYMACVAHVSIYIMAVRVLCMRCGACRRRYGRFWTPFVGVH
jgi:hypothetical protein